MDFRTLKESNEIECKAAQGQNGQGEVPKDFWETYSSMANTDGGSIFLGVEEKKDGFQILGIQNTDKVIKELVDTANNRQKISVNLIRNEDIILHEEGGLTVIEVKIRRASRKERPVYLKNNPLGNSYRRRHEADHRMTDMEVKRMLADQQYESLDYRILKGFGLDDLDQASLHSFRQSVMIRTPEARFDDLSDIDFLKQVGVWRKNRETGDEGLTIAGLLMFGTYETIQDEFPHYFVDYQERAESQTTTRYLDRVCPDATWSGNLYDFYRKVYPKLVSDLKVGFQLKDGIRESESPAHVAVREAFVNALVHADYSIATSLLVVKRPDLFGFKNPGLMRLPLEVAMAGGESDSRNKSLQDLFRRIGAGERQGEGIRKIIEGWKQFDWRLPHFEEKEEPSPQVVVTLSMLSLFPEEAVKFLNLRLGMGWNRASQVEKTALMLAYTEGAVTHSRLSQFSTEHSHDLSQVLQKLENEGNLASTGQYRAKTYHIDGHKLPSPDEVFKSSPDNGSSSPDKKPSFPDKKPSFPDKKPSSPDKDEFGRILHPDFNYPFIDSFSSLQSNFLSELLQLAEEPRVKKRVKAERMESLILKVCSRQYVTMSVLAELLCRKPENLRAQYLAKLKNEGKIHMAFPRTPTDPNQAYISSI